MHPSQPATRASVVRNYLRPLGPDNSAYYGSPTIAIGGGPGAERENNAPLDSAQNIAQLNTGVATPRGGKHHSERSRRMHPSNTTRGATRVTILPPVGREESLEYWGLSTSAHWPELDEFASPTGWDDPEQAERDLEEVGFILDGAWTPVDTTRGSDGAIPGARDAGMTAHRGALQAGEYVDPAVLQGMVERELGFTYEQVRSVYRQGPLSAEQRELRGAIDARLLALSRAGGDMTALARALGFQVKTERIKGDSSCWTMEQALNRARAAEPVAA